MQESILNIKAMGILMPDPHVDETGCYEIHSLYFDDINDTCLWENLGGTDPRSKFRIRYYNNDTGFISLEKISKTRGMTLKESCILTRSDCKKLMMGEIPDPAMKDPEIKHRLLTELKVRGLMPKVIVSYQRIPYIYTGGNVRITIDKAITSSPDIGRFLDGDFARRPVLPLGNSILEVKWDEVLPRHIKETMALDDLNWTAFSKYYMCRMLHL